MARFGDRGFGVDFPASILHSTFKLEGPVVLLLETWCADIVDSWVRSGLMGGVGRLH